MEEERRQYMTLMRGMLDLTDNIVGGEIVPPAGRARAGRRRRLPGGRGRQGHRPPFRHRQRGQRRVRLLAGRRVRLRRVGGLRPQGAGDHRQGRLGERQAALPRDRPRRDVRAVHGRRHRRHVGRRVRQRHAALTARTAGRPPSTTGTSSSTPTRTPASSFAERRRLFELPRQLLGRLRPLADLGRRRRLAAHREGDPTRRRRRGSRWASRPRR